MSTQKQLPVFLKQFEGLSLAKTLLTTDGLIAEHNSARMDTNSRECNMISKHTTSTNQVESRALITAGGAIQLLKNIDSLREALASYLQRNGIGVDANIKTAPTFYEPQHEVTELSDSARKTFSRIGERAREAFIAEQTTRAYLHNISFNPQTIDYFQLSEEIDRYEFLLEEAREFGFYWDTTIYDPLALEQEVKDYKEAEYHEREYVHNDYLSARRVAV